MTGDPSTSSNAINKVASINQLLYIATSMGMALLVSCWMFFRISGSAFNVRRALQAVV